MDPSIVAALITAVGGILAAVVGVLPFFLRRIQNSSPSGTVQSSAQINTLVPVFSDAQKVSAQSEKLSPDCGIPSEKVPTISLTQMLSRATQKRPGVILRQDLVGTWRRESTYGLGFFVFKTDGTYLRDCSGEKDDFAFAVAKFLHGNTSKGFWQIECDSLRLHCGGDSFEHQITSAAVDEFHTVRPERGVVFKWTKTDCQK
jgi:hypothetical protein